MDCLIIGHNESNFVEYEKVVQRMGVQSGAYRDLNLNFLTYNTIPMSAPDVYNMLCREETDPGTQPPLTLGETFNAAVAYLGTYLHRRGYTFDFINGFQEEKERLAECLRRSDILTVAITTTLYVSPFPLLEVVRFVKLQLEKRSALGKPVPKIIIGGPYISTQVRLNEDDPDAMQNQLKTLGADVYVNSAQGETALVNIIEAFKSGSPLEKISNIYYRSGEGYSATAMEREDNRLSENTVDWELFKGRIGNYAGIRTTISCPFRCSFCGFPQHAGEYQLMGREELECEFDGLRRSAAVRHLHFIDDTFNVPPRRFKEILRMMIDNQYGFRWHSHFRCQYADVETVKMMKESGCEGVFLGIESGSDGILANMNKNVTVRQYREGIALLKEYGITTFGCFIIGFPGETSETVQETLQFIRESGLDFYRVQLWYCDPITPIWRQREKYGIQGAHFQWCHAGMDWHEAAGYIEDIFLTVDDPIWVPQYNFEFDALFHLLHRGHSMEQVKRFLTAFRDGIREKLKNPGESEPGYRIIQQLKQFQAQQADKPLNNTVAFQADFDF